MILHTADIKEYAIALLQHGVVRLMVRIGGIGPEGDERRKGKALGAEILINLQHLIRNLPLGHALVHKRTELCHGCVVDVRSAAHLLLLFRILHAAGLIDRERAVHKAGRRLFLHERQQEARRELLVHAEDSVPHEIRCNHFSNRIGVGEPDFLDAAVFRRIEELVEEEDMLTVLPTQKPEETLVRIVCILRQIVNRQRIYNQHLGKSLFLQCFQNPLHTLLFHTEYPFSRIARLPF